MEAPMKMPTDINLAFEWRAILNHVIRYGERKRAAEKAKAFVPGETYLPASAKVIGGREYTYAVAAVLEGWLTEGDWTDAFEAAFAKYLGVRHASFCNSGSSANFLALGALTSPLVGHSRLRPNDPVITSALGFPTTISPILFWRLRPVFIDVELGTYVPSPRMIADALEHIGGDNARGAVFLAHTLGSPWDVRAALESGPGISIIEDNCDALGSEDRHGMKTGSRGCLATHSFYPAHHITTGEGGMVTTNSGRLKKAVESIRDWGRDCWCPPGHDNTCKKRFDWHFPNLPEGYDHKYTYSHLGMNLKSTDIQAAIGLAQMAALESFTKARQANAYYLKEALLARNLVPYFHWPFSEGMPSPFGFPLTIRDASPGKPMLDRQALIAFLESRKIGTRLMFAGNFLRQPVFTHYLTGEWATRYDTRRHLPNTDKIARDGFWIGCHPAMPAGSLDYVADMLEEFVRGV